MGRKSKVHELIESNLGQHIALAVAAHLARTTLVPDPLAPYDGQHLAEMVNTVAHALARVAPLYVRDAESSEPRELTPLELEGALIERSAISVVLRDGRRLGSVTMKRADLRQAIAILKAVGVHELAPFQARRVPAAPREQPDRLGALASSVAELEELLRPPLLRARAERANRIAVSIARGAPHGRIANRAMQLVSVLHQSWDEPHFRRDLELALARLGRALEETELGAARPASKIAEENRNATK